MRHTIATIVAICCLIASASTLAAASLADRFSSFVIFGDSLTDPGNTPLGRFTDGRVWAEHLSDEFTTPGTTANFAIGGGRAIGPDANDLDAQLTRFAGAVGGNLVNLGTRPLAAIWFGGNDVFSALFTDQGVIDPAEAARKVTDTISNLYSGYGIRDFLVFDLPDQGKTPLASAFSAQAVLTARSGLFNTTLTTELDALAPQINDYRVPISDIFDQAIADPALFGVANMDVPCHLDPGSILDRSVCTTPGIAGQPASLFGFYDPVHPNSVVHQGIARTARLSIVPLPATAPLLLAAGGVLVLLRRRRRA